LILFLPLAGGAFLSTGWSWGFDHLHRISRMAAVFFFAVSILVWIPSVRQALTSLFDWVGKIFERAPMRMSVFLALNGLACFLLWPIATRIYGDSRFILDNHSPGNLAVFFDEMTSFGLLARGRASFILHDLLARATGFSFERSYEIVSALCGGLFLFALGRLAATLRDTSSWVRACIVWIGLTDAANQLFFGHIENYTIPRLFGALFLIGVVQSLFGPRSGPDRTRFIPGIWFVLAVLFHTQALVLLPTFLLWIVWELAPTRPSLGRLLQWKFVAIGLILATAAIAFVYVFSGSSAYDYIYSGGRPDFRQLFLPWTTSDLGVPYLNYTLFSGGHFLDLFSSLYSISSPAILLVLVVFALGARADRRFLVLAPSIYAAGLHNFILNPAIGFPFDWDLMSVLSLPLLFSAIFLLVRQKGQGGLLVPAVLVLGLGTLTVHGINAKEVLVRERVEDMGVWLHRSYYGGSHYRISANLTTIGDRQEQIRERRRVLGRLEGQVYENDREVAFLWEKLATIEIEVQDYAAALTSYRRSVEVEPLQWLRLKPLGYLESEIGDPAAGRNALERYLEKAPRDAEAWLFLGDSFARADRIDLAVEHWQMFLEIDPTSKDALRVREDLERLGAERP